MNKQDFEAVIENVISALEKMEHHEGEIMGVGYFCSDESDIGNQIGIAAGEILAPLGIKIDHFLYGVKHGFSLKDGTHDKPPVTPETTFKESGLTTRAVNACGVNLDQSAWMLPVKMLAQISKKELKNTRTIGKVTYAEIIEFATRLGIRMRD